MNFNLVFMISASADQIVRLKNFVQLAKVKARIQLSAIIWPKHTHTHRQPQVYVHRVWLKATQVYEIYIYIHITYLGTYVYVARVFYM